MDKEDQSSNDITEDDNEQGILDDQKNISESDENSSEINYDQESLREIFFSITEEYIKRIIGLPGDQVRIEDGDVFVNDVLLSEPYVLMEAHYEGEWVVPENALFVLGDNRNNSSDSHNWGMVPMDNVSGEALLVYWPPSAWGLVNGAKPVLASE